jgi:membrane-associated protein
MDWFNPTFLIQTLGLIGVFAVIFAESGTLFGLFFPGDSLLFVAGLFASKGFFSVWVLYIGAAAAAILGDSVGYWFGAKLGPAIFTKEESLFFKKSYIEKTQHFYSQYGAWTVFVARFIPIVRTFAPIMAGVGNMPYRTFIFWNILGGIVWAAVFIFGGYFLGNLLPEGEHTLSYVTLGIIIVSLVPAGIQVFRIWKNK